MQFRLMFFWEFIQNLPLVAGLMVGIQLWQDAFVIAAVGVMLIGSLVGAILIRLTESRIVGRDQAGLHGGQEPLAVTLTNAVLMFLFTLLLTIYLTAVWSSIITDLLAGSLIGFILSAGQSKAANQPVSGRHSLAFAAAFPVTLITIRLFSAQLPVAAGILVITAVVTLIITFIDYGHLATIKEGAN